MNRTVVVGKLKFNDTLSFVDSLSDCYLKTETSSAAEISSALDSISVDTSDFLSRREGGTVSGDICAYNLDVLSGNYVQTQMADDVVVFSRGNAFLQAETEAEYGRPTVGSMGYCVISVIDDYSIRLSGDLSELCAAMTEKRLSDYQDLNSGSKAIGGFVLGGGELSDARFSIALGPQSGSMRLQIQSVDLQTGIVRFRSDDLKKVSIIPDADWLHKWDYSVQPRRDLGRFDISDYVDLFYTDDNAFYLVGAPELGNVKIHNFYNQHAEGGSVRAVGKYTHAEGRDNIADVRYAHVEGTHCAACDMASHAEGFWTKAGGRFSHTEGRETRATGVASHAEGLGSVAAGQYSHAGGWGTSALGDWSFANGRFACASSFSTVAMGAYVSAIATNTFAAGTYVSAMDGRAFVWNGRGNSPDESYASHGYGTFNVNPEGGVNGFYVGPSSLAQHIRQQLPNMSDYAKTSSLTAYAKTSSLTAYAKTSALTAYAKTSSLTEYAKTSALTAYAEASSLTAYSKTSSLTAYLKPSDFAPPDEKTGWITNSKAWNFVGPQETIDNVFKFVAIPVSSGQTVTVKTSDVNPAFITMLSGDRNLDPVNGQPAGVVQGWSGPHNDYKGRIPIGETSSFAVPDKATLLWCCTKFYGAEAAPKSISVDGNEVVRNPALDGRVLDGLLGSGNLGWGGRRSRTANQFDKDDPTNVDGYFLSSANGTAYKYAIHPTPSMQYFGTTHFIPCRKGDTLVCTAKSFASTGGRAVVRAIQYFDAGLNVLSCASSGTGPDMGFSAVGRSSFISSATWYGRVMVDGCRYVKLCYDCTSKDSFMVRVEGPNYTPSEAMEYVPFEPATDGQSAPGWEGKTILFAGDSITRPLIKKYSSEQDIESGKGLTTKGYAEFMCDRLGAKVLKQTTKTSLSATAWDGAMLALSAPGQQATDAAGRVSLVNKLSAWPTEGVDAVYVAIGTNDWNYSWCEFGRFGDKSLSTFYGALDYACRTLLDKYPGKPIFFATPIKRWQNFEWTALSDIAPSKGWITNTAGWNNGAYQYKVIPVPYPNSEIEIKGSAHPSCDTWYAFLSAEPTTAKTNVYVPYAPVSAWTPGQNMIRRGTVKNVVSPPVESYLFLTYSRNDQTQYGTDSGNAWPEYVKINGEDGFTYPSSRYDYMNGRSKSLGDYADAIKRVCGRYGIKVVDMYGDCPINPEVTAHVRAFIPDGTHPTPAGHELMGKYAAGAVAQVIP